MGREEQLTKPEGRKGDDVAYYTALVSLDMSLHCQGLLIPFASLDGGHGVYISASFVANADLCNCSLLYS